MAKLEQLETKTITEPPKFPYFQARTRTDVSRQEFAVFGAGDPIMRAAGWWTTAGQAFAVPQEALKRAGVATAASPVRAPGQIATVENDLRVMGSSERNFPINPLLSKGEVSELLLSLRASGGDALSVSRTSTPKDSFSLIQYQTSGASCAAIPASWPFDAGRVKTIMEFNAAIRRRLKAGTPTRSRVLIVDTGLGKALAQTEAFNKLLYADPAELMAPATEKRDFGDPRCTDANGNGYWRDVYGTGSGAKVPDDTRCLISAFSAYDLVDPYPRKPTSELYYQPDHGSFVGGLAVGGPGFVKTFPQIADYVGLSFFRVPRQSPSKEAHIYNEYMDIGISLDYAKKIDADVINMSLKTDRDEPFKPIIKENEKALLVAAAGNNGENLDSAPDNLPAVLNLPDRMIVVAALQPSDSDPFWPDSAQSTSKVHIAAPGALITSYNAAGEEICYSGTSAAAPLVSFVAATIKALTGAQRHVIRARVLAAADHVERLEDKVEEGRRLNVEAALDVFVDRIELKESARNVLRGWIEPDRLEPLVQVCKDPSGSLDNHKGQIDLALLWEWRRRADGKITLRYNASTLSNSFEQGSCDAPSGTFKFFDRETKTIVDIDWGQVKKLLPSPFRSVKSIILD